MTHSFRREMRWCESSWWELFALVLANTFFFVFCLVFIAKAVTSSEMPPNVPLGILVYASFTIIIFRLIRRTLKNLRRPVTIWITVEEERIAWEAPIVVGDCGNQKIRTLQGEAPFAGLRALRIDFGAETTDAVVFYQDGAIISLPTFLHRADLLELGRSVARRCPDLRLTVCEQGLELGCVPRLAS